MVYPKSGNLEMFTLTWSIRNTPCSMSHSPPTRQSHNSYATKPVPPPQLPIRPVHNLTLEIIDTAACLT